MVRAQQSKLNNLSPDAKMLLPSNTLMKVYQAVKQKKVDIACPFDNRSSTGHSAYRNNTKPTPNNQTL